MSGEGSILGRFDIRDFKADETDRYSVWVYFGSNGLPQVYEDEMPNTTEVWFTFHRFTHFYWKLLEDECIDETRAGLYYNYNKLREFMLRRMLCATSIPSVIVEYDDRGFLTERSFESVMRVHPRILRTLMEKVDVLPKPLSKSDERELEQECSILFGKGEGVSSPHEYVTLYCNLVAFWDKFGMNYFDLLKLPQDVFSALKKVMTLESNYRSMKMEELSKQEQQASRRPQRPHGRSVTF